MPCFTWEIPEPLQPKVGVDTPAAVTEFLAKQGVTVQGVTVASDPLRLEIEAASDPATVLDTYAGQPSARQDRLQKAEALVRATHDTIAANQSVTLAELAKGFAALVEVVQARTTGLDVDGTR